MIVCVGASASGKTELAKLLYNHYGYQKCITTTTRAKRGNEKDDIDYHFVSLKDFLELENKDAFFEVTKYHGNLYGIQKKDVHKKGIVIVDPNGANTLIDKLDKDAFVVFVESSEKLREQRMNLRNDNPNIIKDRLINDKNVFIESNLSRIDLKVINESHQLSDLAELVDQSYKKHLSK